MDISQDFSSRLEQLKNIIQADKSFDIVYRIVEIGGRKGCLFFVDGMTKDEVLLKILQVFQNPCQRTLTVFLKNVSLTGKSA